MSSIGKPAYIVAAKRTAVGKAPRGVFARTRPDNLLAHVIKGLMTEVPTVDLEKIADVIIGCAMPEGEQGMNVARIASLLAGLPDAVPGMTVNRFCSSGLQTIAMACDRIALGEADLMIAGGVESMSLVPMGGNKLVANPAYFDDEGKNLGIAYGMGITAEIVAERWKVSRESQDQFALQSHERALAAIDAGHFKQEILPLDLSVKQADLLSGEVQYHTKQVIQDEGPRPGSNLEALGKLRSVFAAKGSVTAGNSSQMSDGASALLIASEQAVKDYELTPMARFCGFSVAGVAAETMGIGPVAAIPKVLAQTEIKLSDIDWIELNEAFAAQSLAVIHDLNLDPSKVNPQGGAIALGHPLGATGAIRATSLIHGLQRTKGRYGMVTMCIGTGMGAAGIFERL